MSRNEKIKRIDIALAIAVVVLTVFCLILLIDRKHDKNVIKEERLKAAILNEGNTVERATKEKAFFKKYVMSRERKLLERENVLSEIAAGEYDAIVLSSETNNWKEEWFSTYIGNKACIVDEKIINPEDLQSYLEACANSNGKIKEIYLKIDPTVLEENYYLHQKYGDTDLTFIQKMQECLWTYMGECQGILFHVILPVYSIDKWNSFSIMHIADVENDWDQFIRYSCRYTNMEMTGLSGEEWIISNENYFTNEGIMKEELQFYEFIKSFGTDFRVDYNSCAELLENIAQYRKNDINGAVYRPDLSLWDIVFMGDGTIADSGWGVDSVSDMVASLSKARTYNFAIGGSTVGGNGNNSFYSLAGSLEKRETSVPEEIAQDFEAFLADDHSGRKTVFVVMYGSGDYISAVRLGDEDHINELTYYGALTQGVRMLKGSFAGESEILLVTPGYISVYDGGLTAASAEGATLPEYVSTMKKVSSAEGTRLFDNYSKGIVNKSNADIYLYKELFPEIEARYQTSKLLIELMDSWTK